MPIKLRIKMCRFFGGFIKVVDQIDGILNADLQAQPIVSDTKPLSFCLGRVINEGVCKREQTQPELRTDREHLD